MPIQPPDTDEYAPYYAGYVQRVPDGEVFETLRRQIGEIQQTLGGLSDEDGLYRYAPGQWSIKEVVGHLCDCERVFVYRACAFARNEQASLPGFDQEAYVREARYDERALADLVQELVSLRQATLLSLGTLTHEISLRRGTASGMPISVRALVYITAGHAYQHLESLQTEYLPGVTGSSQENVSPVAAK